jgi:hypothetical protein
MIRRLTLLVGLLASAMILATIPVLQAQAAAAAPAPTAVKATATARHATWTSGGAVKALTGLVARPTLVTVSTLPSVASVQTAEVAAALSSPLRVSNPAAYAAAKSKPSGGPGVQIGQQAGSHVDFTFSGIDSHGEVGLQGFAVQPPDTQMAVGNTQVVEMVNQTGQVFNKVFPNAAIGTLFSLKTFFGMAAFDPNYVATDPRILYDYSTDRWYASMLGFNPTTFDSTVFFAVSRTSDATGAWAVYQLYYGLNANTDGTSLLCDQPKIGYSADKFIAACTDFDHNGFFVGGVLIVASKTQGLAGASMTVGFLPPTQDTFGVVAAQNVSAGLPAFWVQNNSNGPFPSAATRFFAATGDPAAGLGGVFIGNVDVPMTATTIPPRAVQSGTATTVDTGDDRFMSAVVQNGELWTSANTGCTPTSDTIVRSCMRVLEFALPFPSVPTVDQSSTAGINGKYIYYPTLNVDSSGDVTIAYSMSSAADFPGVFATQQPAGDSGLFIGGGPIWLGTKFYQGSRWGDYSAAAIDLYTPGAVWVAGEWSGGSTDTVAWGTAIGRVSRIAMACQLTSFTASPTSPSGPSTPITLTATSGCVTNATAEYEFWIQMPGGSWTIAQAFSPTNTVAWNSHTTLGTYHWEVRVRAIGETRAYDDFRDISYDITAIACMNPTLTPGLASPQLTHTSILLTASSTSCGAPPPLYQFWVRTPDHIWHLAQDYSAGSTYTWNNLNAAPGAYLLEVDVKNTGSIGAYDAFIDINYTLVSCFAPTLTPSASSPYPSGNGAVTLTATGSCDGGAVFQFWIRSAAGVWAMVQNYSATNTYSWPADTAQGNYVLEVDIRPVGSSASYTTFVDVPFQLTGCTGPISLSSTESSPQVAGTTIHWTGGQACSGTPNYQFWVRSPSLVWTLMQDWGTSNTFTWNSPTVAGNYLVEIVTRNQGAVNDPYDRFLDAPFTLGLCNQPAFTSSIGNPYPSGNGGIVLTASGTCAGGTEFEFWARTPAGVWSVIRAYGAGNSASWPANYHPGNYMFEVDIRPAGSAYSYVTYVDQALTLSGCSTVPTLVSSQASPQPGGTSVTFTAGGGTCTGAGGASFEFWLYTPGSGWAVVQPYSATTTWTWNTAATLGNYMVEVDVRNAGATNDPYDTYKDVNFSVGMCSTPSLFDSLGPTYPTGAGPITLTANANCGGGGTEYEFWARTPAGVWSVIRAYNATTFTTWPANYAPGNYMFEVDVRPAGSSLSYVTYFDLPLTLTGCTTVPTLTSDVPSPQPHAATVTFTAGGGSCSGASASFRFWVFAPGTGWAIIQDWGASNTFVWSTHPASGSYQVEVDIRNVGATNDPYDKFKAVPYNLT